MRYALIALALMAGSVMAQNPQSIYTDPNKYKSPYSQPKQPDYLKQQRQQRNQSFDASITDFGNGMKGGTVNGQPYNSSRIGNITTHNINGKIVTCNTIGTITTCN